MAGSALGVKLRDEIAHCAIGVTEALRYFAQRLAFHNDRANGLVASLHGRLRIEEKVSAQAVVHDLPSKLSLLFAGETVGKWYSQSGVGNKGKGRKGVWTRKFRGETHRPVRGWPEGQSYKVAENGVRPDK